MSSEGSGPAQRSRLFSFVQFEFPWDLGPPPGRYVLRDSAVEADLRVLVIATVQARERRLVGRRRARKVAPEPEPAPVGTTRATVVRGVPLTGEDERREWMRDPETKVAAELAVLNRVIHAHRVAAADPAVRPVAVEQALAVRVGYGAGEEVAEGRWTEAVEPPPERLPLIRRPSAALRPQERLAALLGGRDAALACEELTLRARADLDAGRLREAALELRVALEAALAELEAYRDQRDLGGRLAELRDERAAVGGAANAALAGGLPEEAIEDVRRVVARLEAALRARVAAPPG